MPELIYFTKFEEEKFQLEEEEQVATHMTYLKKKNSSASNENTRIKSGSNSKRNHFSKKEFTKNNMVMSFPINYDSIKSTYLNCKKGRREEQAEIFEGICSGQKLMKEEGEDVTFRV